MTSKHQKSFSCYLLIGLHIFLGVGALFGGGALILSPDGSMLHIPLNLLHHSPFNSYLIPGIILFFVLGIIPLMTALFLITEKQMKFVERLCMYKDTHWSWHSSLYLGFILIIWITIEIYMVQGIAFIQVFYIFLGLFIQSITLLPSVKEHYAITH
ncbi:hypothetical protein [Neobacillus jeddahensis]|uniref:hypothetical protein n=1 Tax=Neobacillus jeddahensis TaxID=1461580 RepID=UPI00058DC6DD|nr:hypothetical protein [Neobacillus jeddahensis]